MIDLNTITHKYVCSQCKNVYFSSHHFDIQNNICNICNRRNGYISQETSSKEITIINIDLVRDLRFRGMSFEANSLLRAFRNSVDSEKKQLNKEIIRKDALVTKFYKKYYKICSNSRCNRKRFKYFSKCIRCISYRKNIQEIIKKQEASTYKKFRIIFDSNVPKIKG